MGQIALPGSGLVYVDANSLIYAIEGIEPYRTASLPLWNALHAGAQQVVTSDLTLLEVLVQPLRIGDQTLITLYRTVLLGTIGFSCIPIDRQVLESAANLRGRYGLKTPDAIHAATALSLACAMFVTNDAGFRRVPGLNVVVLDEVVAS